MRYLVYKTTDFERDIDGRYNERIRKLIEEVERSPTMLGGFERYPKPFLKRRIGNYRIVVEERQIDKDATALCFVRFVPRGDSDYAWLTNGKFDDFKKTYNLDGDKIAAWAEARLEDGALEELSKLDDLESQYLFWSNESSDGRDDHMVYETADWVTAMESDKVSAYRSSLAEVVIDAVMDTAGSTRKRHKTHDVGVIYRNFENPRRTVLISPTYPSMTEDKVDEVCRDHRDLIEGPTLDEEALLRKVRRAYPAFITLETSLWMETQGSRDANLALSPEEAGIIDKIIEANPNVERFPLFINGRPGSGKSTVLQYLFARMLSFHLGKPRVARLKNPPLYLTYNDALLDRAKKVVKDILRCDSQHLLAGSGALSSEEQEELVDGAFGSFREFMLALLPRETRKNFKPEFYVGYSEFRQLWEDQFSRLPERKRQELGPELSWHVIRTYIKGMRVDAEDNFDPDSYSDYPDKRKSVSQPTFERIYNDVWKKWYQQVRDAGYWDDQDLTREVLDLDQSFAVYPAVFCDEAQDFTRQELEFIFSLSLYSKRDIPSHFIANVPFAFAGDPFQTLNPTGFDWDTVQSDFHENIVANFGAHDGNIKFNFKELRYNYRSSDPIARLGNTVQLLRGVGFEIKRLEPQMVYFDRRSSVPEYFFRDDPQTRQYLKDQEEVVIIVPCQEGGELAYVKGDQLLSTIALNQDGELVRNVLSPMRAKGLEFNRVVLYGFGDKGLTDGDLDTLASQLKPLDVSLEERLAAEYFMNQLYVAVSRAQLRLLIVDGRETVDRFWSFASTSARSEELLEQYNGMHSSSSSSHWEPWTKDDLGHIHQGSGRSWEQDRDNPKDLAEKFLVDGETRKDSFMLRRAARLFRTVDDNIQAGRATALAYECEKALAEAAKAYLDIGEHDEAARCFWQARDFDGLAELDPTRLKKREREWRAAQFLGGENSFGAAAELLGRLKTWLDDARVCAYIIKDDIWAEVAVELVEAFGRLAHGNEDQDRGRWRSVWGQLLSCQHDGLLLPDGLNLLLIANRAEEFEDVARIWDGLAIKPPLESWLAAALAKSKSYPEKLPYLAEMGMWDEIISEYHAHPTIALSKQASDAIIRAMIGTDRIEHAVKLIEENPSTNALQELLALPAASISRSLAHRLAELLLQRCVADGRLLEAIDLTRNGANRGQRSRSNAWSHVPKKDLTRFLIRVFARSEEVSAADTTVKQEISRFLSRQASDYRTVTALGIDPREHGAAIERAGRRTEALSYYQNLFKHVKWTQDSDLKTFARLRWARAKREHLEAKGEFLFATQDKAQYEKHLQLHDFTDEFIKSQPQFPRWEDLPPLLLTEVELKPKVVEVESPSLLKSPRQEPTSLDMTNAPAFAEEVAVPESPIIPDVPSASISTVPNSSIGATPVTLPGLPLDAFNGQYTLSGVTLEIQYLPQWARMQLKDPNNGTQVFLEVGRSDLHSSFPDLEITSVEEPASNKRAWAVEPWGLRVELHADGEFARINLGALESPPSIGFSLRTTKLEIEGS